MKDIGSLGNNENFFDGFKISKSSVNNIAYLATALDLIKDSLDGFGPEARNALSSLEFIAKNTKILQQVKAPDQSGESSGKPKKPITMEDTIRDAWKQAELEDIKRTEGAYDSLIGKLTKYTNLVSKKASGKPFTTQEAKDFANLSEQINKAINKQGIYATTTEQAEAANRRFNTELEKMKQLYSETAVANYDKRFEGFKAQESDKIPQYADALKEMEESLARIKKLSPVDLFDEAAMKEYSHEVESFEKLAVDLKSKKYNFVPDDKKHTVISNFESWANQNTAALRQYGDEIERVRSLFNNIVSPADLDEATSAFKRIQAEVNRTGKVGKSFADIWKSRIQSLFVYLSSFVSFYDAIGVLRQGFDVIKDYDTALTEMQKVSDASYKSLKDFQEASFALGDTVGSTGKQIQNSTADFLRLGESFEEAKKSAIDANTLFKVSEFGTIEEATDAMISMSQAYKELKKSEINDILNNVGNNFSISTEGLATALQTSAAALKVAGNDINEAVALITAGNAIVQDPSQVGAGMRTISLRILGTEQAKDELASLGEDVEDFVVQTASKIDETVKAYTAVASNQFKGVSLLDDNGNYRDTYEILQDIADVYQEILETDKKAGTNRGQALIELLAGKNRANIAASILSNPDLLRDVYETSLDSAGSAQAELDKYLASIEAHLEKVRNQWESIWITDKNREIINFFLDATAAVLQFTEAVGLLPIASGAGGLALFVKNFGRSVKDCIKLPKFFMLADCG
ncbi:MAG: phage tail tape measure protein [Lachnospiraceae bacterium]